MKLYQGRGPATLFVVRLQWDFTSIAAGAQQTPFISPATAGNAYNGEPVQEGDAVVGCMPWDDGPAGGSWPTALAPPGAQVDFTGGNWGFDLNAINDSAGAIDPALQDFLVLVARPQVGNPIP